MLALHRPIPAARTISLAREQRVAALLDNDQACAPEKQAVINPIVQSGQRAILVRELVSAPK
jgi:hypothetical protein